MLLKDVQNHQAAAILVEHMPKLSLSTLVELADTLTLPNDLLHNNLMVTLEAEIQERKDLAEAQAEEWAKDPNLCKHGTTVGGVMFDLMCHACEEGYD